MVKTKKKWGNIHARIGESWSGQRKEKRSSQKLPDHDLKSDEGTWRLTEMDATIVFFHIQFTVSTRKENKQSNSRKESNLEEIRLRLRSVPYLLSFLCLSLVISISGYLDRWPYTTP